MSTGTSLPLCVLKSHRLLVGNLPSPLYGLQELVSYSCEVYEFSLSHFIHLLYRSKMLWPSDDRLHHVPVRDLDDICPSLGTGDFSRPSLEAPVWHSLLLGAIENNSHFVALLVGVHCPANEESSSLPLALSEDATSSLSRPLCPGNQVLTTPLSRIRATCGAFLRTRMTMFFSVIMNLEHVQPYHFTICV